MLIAEFSHKGEEIEIDDALWQHDYGQKIQIKGLDLPEVFEVHFAWKDIEKAKVVTGSTIDGVSTVDIPNVALEQRRAITAYVYLSNAVEGETVNTILMTVNKRKAPENFEIPEKIDLFHHTVEATAEYQRQAKESEERAAGLSADAEAWAHGREDHPDQAQDNAKYYAEQAAKSAAEVPGKTEQAKKDIEAARKRAVSAVTSQQETSVQAVATEGKKHTDATKKYAETVASSRQAVEETAQAVATQAQEVSQNTQTVANNTNNAAKSAESAQTSANNAAKSAEGAQTSANNAAKSAEGVQGAVDQITKNTQDVASLKEDISTKITKFYASNQGETHITDSDNGKIQDMKVFGNSEQKKYNGYQLFALAPINISTGEKVSLPYTENGITVDIANDGIGYTVRGTNTLNERESDVYLSMINAFDIEAGTYTRSGKIINGNNNVELISGGGVSNGGCLEYKPIKADFTFTETVKKGKSGNFIIRISPRATVNAIVYFQIEKGSEAHNFEPYTGGIPSPNPDYPQKIKSVVNPMIKVCGVNLFDQTKVFKNIDIGIRSIVGINCYNIVGNGQSTDRRYYLIECKPNTKYYITFVNPNNNIFIGVADKNYIGIKDVSVFENITSRIFTTGNNAKFIVLNADGTSNICISEDNAAFEPYHEQTIQLPYTLNAIPVESGGNVTINGQKYIADYVDVERGKIVRNVENITFNGAENENWELWNADKEKMWSFMFVNSLKTFTNGSVSKCNRFEFNANESIDRTFWLCNPSGMPSLQIKNRIIGKDITAFKSWLSNNPINVIYPLRIPIEEELTAEHAQALKELATYYPVTNISIGSEQLDGYTVFNYPISMANGWNYVKKQLNDNRDYIYDMDIQSAEAYVNSEYAVALTELEV